LLAEHGRALRLRQRHPIPNGGDQSEHEAQKDERARDRVVAGPEAHQSFWPPFFESASTIGRLPTGKAEIENCSTGVFSISALLRKTWVTFLNRSWLSRAFK